MSRRDAAATTDRRRRGRFWPWFIVGLLASNVLGALALVLFALDDPSHQIEQDYYKRALHWDREMEQERVNQALGWRATVSFERPAKPTAVVGTGPHPALPETSVVATLVDRAAAPLRGARVTLETFALARSGRRLRAALTERGSGRYAAPLLLFPLGRWRFLLRVERGGQRFTATLEDDVSASLAATSDPTSRGR